MRARRFSLPKATKAERGLIDELYDGVVKQSSRYGRWPPWDRDNYIWLFVARYIRKYFVKKQVGE